MRASTSEAHAFIAALGRELGFVTSLEVSDTATRVRPGAANAYAPRVDVLWSLELTEAQQLALAWALGPDSGPHPTKLAIVGWEVEGTTPSTKGITADIANLAALGAPLGFVVVNDDPSRGGERGIYRRAVRVARTLRHQFGDHAVVPMDLSWLEGLQALAQARPGRARSASKPAQKRPSGGETGDWARGLRGRLSDEGHAAGFLVAQDYRSPSLPREAKRLVARGLTLPSDRDPANGTAEPMMPRDYFTQSKIDVTWSLPLPSGLGRLAHWLAKRDPALVDSGLLDPERYEQLVVLAVELETSEGKHAGGGLLNLASHGMFGVMATPDPERAETVRRILETYRPTLGLRNVHVRSFGS